jgi:hypothetical protein
MITILKNKKLENGDIESKYNCNFQFEGGCNNKPSLYLVRIEGGTLYTDTVICKSCLNYLISKINSFITDELFNDK